MADSGKLANQASRGMHAKQLLNDEMMQDILKRMEAEIESAWRYSKVDEDDVRQNAYLMLQLLERFKSAFRQIIASGDFAEKELLRFEKEK